MRILLIAILLLMLAPAASATRAAINLGEGLKSADIELFLTMDGQDAVDMRTAMDAFGDHDGQVSISEVEEYADHLKPTLGQKFMDAVQASWTLDGQTPTAVEMDEFEYYHADGPATSDAAFEMEVVMEATYPAPRPGASHDFHFEAGQMGRSQGYPDDVKMSVKAPEGHRIAQTAPADGIIVNEDGSIAQFTDAPTGPQAVVFTLAATDSSAMGSPMTPLAFVVVAVIGAAAVRKARND